MYLYTHTCIYFGNAIKFFSVKSDKKNRSFWHTGTPHGSKLLHLEKKIRLTIEDSTHV